jgi:hypothetical protein
MGQARSRDTEENPRCCPSTSVGAPVIDAQVPTLPLFDVSETVQNGLDGAPVRR